jgi:hypothetical protein
LEEGINRVDISNSSNNRMAVAAAAATSNREAISSNSSSTVKEVTVKIPDTEVLPKVSRISKVDSSRDHLKEHMELLLQSPHLCQSGKLQQHRTVNNTTITKGRGRQLGRNLLGCRKQ